jgi:hypothetical protein
MRLTTFFGAAGPVCALLQRDVRLLFLDDLDQRRLVVILECFGLELAFLLLDDVLREFEHVGRPEGRIEASWPDLRRVGRTAQEARLQGRIQSQHREQAGAGHFLAPFFLAALVAIAAEVVRLEDI